MGSSDGNCTLTGMAAAGQLDRPGLVNMTSVWQESSSAHAEIPVFISNIEALTIRIGFWGPLCYTYNK